jgi:hypothetical protein
MSDHSFGETKMPPNQLQLGTENSPNSYYFLKKVIWFERAINSTEDMEARFLELTLYGCASE